MAEHLAIWLEPRCVAESGEDRHWAQDDAWGACDECGTKSVKYIIATEHDALVKALSGMLDSFGGYSIPEVDAAITAMQALGLDRWSMQSQMERSAINANVPLPMTDVGSETERGK